MPSDNPPRTLAGFYTQRKRVVTSKDEEVEIAESGQMGLLFAAPQPQDAAPAEDKPKETKRERRVWSVADLVSELRSRVEREYRDTWVEGEISNCRLAPSGHLYFTLKDGDAQLPVVMFRRQALLLKFRPEDGHAVLVRGGVSVYESRGQLQLIAEALEPRGEGALRLAFEQLREKLRAEGLFDAERKRPLPKFPKTIGIITSPTGAVLRDIYNITRRRHRCLNLLVYPALMQGTESAAEVRAGIAYFNSANVHRVDVILIARGGGSAEDLWSFNEEALARSIAASKLPVISAVGHETDFTIADFVADLRAPTPSAAAEILTEDYFRAEEQLGSLHVRIVRGIRYQLLHLRQRLAQMEAASVLARVRDTVERRQQHFDTLQFRLQSAVDTVIAIKKNAWLHAERQLARQNVVHVLHQRQLRLSHAEARLRALDPKAVLQRGYALVFDAEGKLIRDTARLKQDDVITAQLAAGRVRAKVTGKDSE